MWSIVTLLAVPNAFGITVPDDHPTLQEAVEAASSGDVIEVRPGSYTESVLITKDLTLEGLGHWSDTTVSAFNNVSVFSIGGGAEVTVRNMTLAGSNRRVLSVDGGKLDLQDVQCTGGSTSLPGGCLRIDGGAEVSIVRGRFIDNSASQGGHIAVFGGSLSLHDSMLLGGYASSYGGAIYAEANASVTVQGSRFGVNSTSTGSGSGGGAIYATGATTLIDDSWFFENSSRYGGAIYARDGGLLQVTDSTFRENTSTRSAGAIRARSTASAHIDGSIFLGNEAGREGGAIYGDGCSNCTVSESWFKGNSSTGGSSYFGGGAAFEESHGALVEGTLFVENSAGNWGGGLAIRDSDNVVIDGGYFCGNSVSGGTSAGGGIEVRGGDAFRLERSILLFNSANTEGGGLQNNQTAGSVVTQNTFLSNSSSYGQHANGVSQQLDLDHNLFAWTTGYSAVRRTGGSAGGVTSTFDWYYSNQTDTYQVVVQDKLPGAGMAENPQLGSFNPNNPNCHAYDVRPQVGSPMLSAGDEGRTPGAFDGTEHDPRWYTDGDGDYEIARDDCNDRDSAIHSGTTWYLDLDGDGVGSADSGEYVGCVPPGIHWVLTGNDCDDADPTAWEEVTAYPDNDGDGYGDPNFPQLVCGLPPGMVTNDLDCDDNDPEAYPGQIWYVDADGDGFGDIHSQVGQCERPLNGVTIGGDCDDTNPEVNPDAQEICNGIDDNCNGLIDDEDPDVDLSDAEFWYLDADGDGYGHPDPDLGIYACDQPEGYADNDLDCDDSDPHNGPPVAWWPDNDGDGFGDMYAASFVECGPQPGFAPNNLDCDDDDERLHPETIWYYDGDGDGFGDDDNTLVQCEQVTGFILEGGDCDDDNEHVHPDADEVCNGIDDNCSGLIDDEDPELNLDSASTWYLDADGDGYGDPGASLQACDPPEGYVGNGDDCDDSNPFINPGMPEQCDDIDHNCDGDDTAGVVDLTWYQDVDGDGYGHDAVTLVDCVQPPGYVLTPGDCDDTNPNINPGMLEICNGVDDNCDGLVDINAIDGEAWAPDADGDGFGDDALVEILCEGPAGWTQQVGDCDDTDDTVYPGATEYCNGKDNDCNGLVDDNAVDQTEWYTDADGDGWGTSEGEVVWACEAPEGYGPEGDCDDTNPAVHPDATEICNGIDDNCSGLIDDDDPELDLTDVSTWYRDADGDSYGDPDNALQACDQPDGYVANDSDCDDSDPLVFPGAPGLDEACEPLGPDGDDDDDDDDDLTPGGGDDSSGGCGCDASGLAPGGLAWLFALALVARRRRSGGPGAAR